MAVASPSTSSSVTMHHQDSENTQSTIVQPGSSRQASHPLPERPKLETPPSGSSPAHAKPRSICRNFIFWGACRDMECLRAHVPHKDMLDLFDYLLQRDDCPSGLRLIRARLTRPSPGMNRARRRSDQICPYFLNGFCRWRNNCFRAHLRSTQIYNSLSYPVKTSAVPPMAAADERPVVKLPEITSCTTQEPLLVDNVSPPPVIV